MIKLVSAGRRSHLPDLVIPISTGSNLLRSIALRIPFAETHEISCSLLFPPQIIPTRSLLIKTHPLKFAF
jgi:hypothetical protein